VVGTTLPPRFVWFGFDTPSGVSTPNRSGSEHIFIVWIPPSVSRATPGKWVRMPLGQGVSRLRPWRSRLNARRVRR